MPTIAIAGTDYQAPISLTTTGSGAATLSGNTLNIPSGTNYTLPTASSSALGGVKIGTSLSIDGNGVLSANISGKMDIADTASMLSNYRTGLNNKLNYTDTSTMLSSYLRKMDTASLSNRINAVNIGLNNKMNLTDTSFLNLVSRFETKLNKADTTAMLSGYLRKSDNATTATLAGNITATTNTTLTSLASLNTVGTITSGTISLTTNISTTGTLKAGAVTYPNTHGTSGQVLTSLGSGTLSWTTVSSGGGLPTTGNTAGDMLYWNGTAWVKVAAGSNGQTLIFSNGAPIWSSNVFVQTSGVFGPVTSSTGKIWMDRNLGAKQVATSYNDYQAYGSLYQWGRGSDGHELINWTNATTGTSANTTTTTISTTDVPGNSNFIVTNNSYKDWRTTPNDNLWQGVNGTNNPCPSGFRLPTITEWTNEKNAWGAITSGSTSAFSSPLKLTVAGMRHFYSGSPGAGSSCYYWASSVLAAGQANAFYFDGTSSTQASGYNRGFGFAVRCIKD